MSATLSSDKVKCKHCNLVVTKKNLKEHTKTVHGPDTKVEFLSTLSVDIRGLFGPPPQKVAKTFEVPAEQAHQEQPSNIDPIVSYTDTADIEGGHNSAILSELESLKLRLDQLEIQKRQPIVVNKADLSTVLSTENILEIIVSCRSVEIILSLLPCFTINNDTDEEGLHCKVCDITLKYDFAFGVTFESSQKLPTQFSHLKGSVKRHVQSPHHISTLAAKEKQTEEQNRLLKTAKVAAVNCASAAYLTYKSGFPFSAYENIVAEVHSSGGHIGLKNHSKEFPRLFLPHMYDVLRGGVSSFVMENKLPFGLLADKMTARHRKRHIIGIRVPIWDLNNSNINRDVYIRHSAVGYGSGEAIVDHLLSNLESFGFQIPYVRRHLIGMAMDGQYTCLNVQDHMSERLQKNVNLSWDPMHRIELASNDSISDMSGFKIITDVVSTIQDTMIKFKVGNNFEILFSEKEVCDTFYTPKVFKDMKFVTYSAEVFKTFVNDFKAFVSASKKIEDNSGIEKKILNERFILHMLLLADINTFLAKFSKMVQKSSNLPWDYSNSLDYVMGQLNVMLDEVLNAQTKIQQEFSADIVIADLPAQLFHYFKTSTEIISKNTYQGLPLHEGPNMIRLRGHEPPPSTHAGILKQLFSFGSRYLAALRDNLNARFDCVTMQVCRSFKSIFDPTPYFYPQSDCSTNEVLSDFASFESFFEKMPFFVSKEEDYKRTLYFQLKETRKVFFKLITSYREKNSDVKINTSSFLKLLYSKLDVDNMAEVRYFMSCMITFPVSEAVVETWGSVIDRVIANKIAFKESESVETTDTPEKVVFIKLIGPPAGASSNRKLFKRALTLMYKGNDYGKHFMAPYGKGIVSHVIERLTSGSINPNASFFS